MAWTGTKEWKSIAGHPVLALACSPIPLAVDWAPLPLILHIGNQGHGQILEFRFLYLEGNHTEVEIFKKYLLII